MQKKISFGQAKVKQNIKVNLHSCGVVKGTLHLSREIYYLKRDKRFHMRNHVPKLLRSIPS